MRGRGWLREEIPQEETDPRASEGGLGNIAKEPFRMKSPAMFRMMAFSIQLVDLILRAIELIQR